MEDDRRIRWQEHILSASETMFESAGIIRKDENHDFMTATTRAPGDDVGG